MSDVRSPLAVKIMEANPRAYQALVVEGGTPALAHELLENVQPDQLLTAPAKSPVAMYAMLAGLWLWHDGLSECHEIVQKSPEHLLGAALNLHSKPSKTSPKVPPVQSVETDKISSTQDLRETASTLAFWHAIMHRREGDFSNGKYWYARVGAHPVIETLTHQAGSIVNAFPADNSVLRVIAAGWKPAAWVDLVEAVHESPADPRHNIAVQLQQLEWNLLFAHCARP
jgi:hypothetical protein